jgi:hemolysin III
VIYAVKRPNPFPGRFGFHEIWHLFVLGGSSLHFAAIALMTS